MPSDTQLPMSSRQGPGMSELLRAGGRAGGHEAGMRQAGGQTQQGGQEGRLSKAGRQAGGCLGLCILPRHRASWAGGARRFPHRRGATRGKGQGARGKGQEVLGHT